MRTNGLRMSLVWTGTGAGGCDDPAGSGTGPIVTVTLETVDGGRGCVT